MDKPVTPCGKECEGLNNVYARLEKGDKLLEEISAKLTNLDGKVSSTNDVVHAWDNAQGFVNTIKAISGFIKLMAPIIAFIGAFYIAMRRNLL